MARQSGKLFTETDIKDDSRFIAKTTLVTGSKCLNNTEVQAKIHVNTSLLPTDGRLPTFDDIQPRATAWRVQASSAYCVQTVPPPTYTKPTYNVDAVSYTSTTTTVRVSSITNGGKYTYTTTQGYISGNDCGSGTIHGTTFDIVVPVAAGKTATVVIRVWNSSDTSCNTYTDISYSFANNYSVSGNYSGTFNLRLNYLFPPVRIDGGVPCAKFYDSSGAEVLSVSAPYTINTPSTGETVLTVNVAVPLAKTITSFAFFYYMNSEYTGTAESIQVSSTQGGSTTVNYHVNNIISNSGINYKSFTANLTTAMPVNSNNFTIILYLTGL